MGVSNDTRRRLARERRYKKAVVSELEYELMQNEICEMMETCDSFRFDVRDREYFLNELGCDEEELIEFDLMFADLWRDLERLSNDMEFENSCGCEAEKWFNDVFAGITSRESELPMWGYDTYEEDYFTLDGFEANMAREAAKKRLMTLTKKELVDIFGTCFEFAFRYMTIQRKYDNLFAALDILRGKAKEHLKLIKDIDKAYEEADAAGWIECVKTVRNFDRLIAELPDKVWVE